MPTPKTILLLDSPSEKLASLLEAATHGTGREYTLQSVATVEDALHVCNATPPACIVTGYQLTNETGLDLLKALRSADRYTSLPVLMVTAHGDEAVAVEAMKLGCRDYLVRAGTTPEAMGQALQTVIPHDADWRITMTWGQEHRLRAVFDNLDEGLVISDLDGNVFFWNQSALTSHGIGDSEEYRCALTKYQENFELVNSEGRILEFEEWPLYHILHNGKLDGVELLLRRLDREWQRLLRYSGAVVHEPNGQTAAFLSVTDITEHKQIEAELQASRQLVQGIADASPNIIYLLDLAGLQRVYSNRRLEDVLGYSQDDGSDWKEGFSREILHPDDLTRVRKHYARFKDPEFRDLEEDAILTVEYRVRHADGSFHWFQSRDTVFSRDSEGRPRQIVGSATDITRLKEAKAALREQAAMNRAVLDSLASHVAVLDRGGNIIATNEAWNRFEVANMSEKAVSRNYTNYLDVCRQAVGDDAQGAMDAHDGILAVLNGEVDNFQLEYPCQSPEEMRWYQMSVTPLDTEHGGAVVSHTSITERKKIEQALEAALRQRERAQSITHLGSVEVDLKTGKTLWSDEYFRLLGYQPQSFEPTIGHFLNSMHPEDRGPAIQMLRDMEYGDISTHEYRFVLPDGTERWLQLQGRLEEAAPGFAPTLWATALDVTQRKKSEEALQIQAERQNLLLNCSRLLLEGRETEAELIQMVFERIQKHLKVDVCFYYSCDWEQGQLNLVKSIGVPESRVAEAKVLLLGQAFCGTTAAQGVPLIAGAERIATDESGSFIRALGVRAYACHPLLSSTGSILGTFSVAGTGRGDFSPEESAFLHTLCHLIAGVAERKRTEIALRESEERFRSTFEQVAVGMAHVDPRGRWLRVNQRLCAILGYTREELLARDFRAITHPDDMDISTEIVLRQLSGEMDSCSVEKRYLRKDGTIIWVNITTALKRDANGAPDYFISVTEDISERKRVEAERKYVMESAGCLLWSCDVREEGGRLIWTQRYFDQEAAQRLVPIDIRPGEYYQQKWHDARFDQDRARNFRYGDQQTRAGLDYQDEFRMWAADGSVHWLREDVRVNVLEPGKSWHVVGVCTEITAFKEALETAHRWTHVFEKVEFGLAHVDVRNGTFIEVNPAFARQRGYTPEELIGKSPLILHSVEHHEEMLRWMRQVDQTGHAVFEATHLRKDGTKFPALVEITLLRDVDGRPTSCITYAQDITDRKQAEAALREEQERFRRTAATVPGVVYQFRIRPDGSISMPYFTASLSEIVDIPLEGLQEDASPLYTRIHPEDMSNFLSEIEYSARTVTDWHSEFRVNHREKGEIWVEGRSTPVQEADGSTLWYGFLSDVTRRKRAEADIIQFNSEIMQFNSDLEARVKRRTSELAQANEEAERARLIAEEARTEAEKANQAKSEFLSRMSHELRTPMNSILGFAQIMEMQAADEKQAGRIAHILQAGQHLLQLINEVLDMARVESGRLTLSVEAISVGQVLDLTLGLIRPLCQQKELVLSNEIGEFGDLYLMSDQQRLSQVLLNFLSNAVKYNRSEGTIRVYGERRGKGDLRLCVHDTGKGISETNQERLFQPFERLGADSAVEGTGLGLALSKRLVEAMGGEIGVESVPEEGSTFWVQLPLTEAPTLNDTPGESDVKEEWNQNEQTLLYVEDNLTNLQLIREVLDDRPNIRLITAMQGKLGIALARKHCPALILLDLDLPDISGEEVLRQLSNDPITMDVPVVIVSADATPGRQERLRKLGAMDYLPKPLNVRSFLRLVSRHIQ